MKPIYITVEGYEKLKEKFHNLKIKSQEIKEEISNSFNDDKESENTPYQEAVAHQAKIDRDLIEVEQKINNAKVIDTKLDYADKNKDIVKFGAIVKVLNLNLNKEIIFQIVGVDEIDLTGQIKKISYESPVGSNLLNKVVGETIDIRREDGNDLEYEVLDIKY